MKKLLLLLIIAFSFTSCLSTKKVEGSIYKTHDKFQQVDFYRNRNPFSQNKSFDIYIVQGSTNYARLLFEYSGSDWLFFEKAIFLNKQNKTISFNFNSWEMERDVISHKKVKEYVDIVITREEAAQLKEVLEGGFVRLRLQGKGYRTYLLKTKGLVKLLDYYLNNM